MCPLILEFLCHFSGSLRLSSISDAPFPRSCVFPVLFGFCLGEDHSCVDGKYTFENMYDWKCIILSSHLINCLTWYRILVVGSATLVVNNFSHDVKDIFLFLHCHHWKMWFDSDSQSWYYLLFLSGSVEGPHFIHNVVKHDDDESRSESFFFLWTVFAGSF